MELAEMAIQIACTNQNTIIAFLSKNKTVLIYNPNNVSTPNILLVSYEIIQYSNHFCHFYNVAVSPLPLNSGLHQLHVEYM